jgi:hypothetical protein
MKTKTTITSIAIAVLFLSVACGGGAAENKNNATNTPEQTISPSNDWQDVDLSTSKLKWAIIAKGPKGYTLDETVDNEVTIQGEGANYRISEWPYGDKMLHLKKTSLLLMHLNLKVIYLKSQTLLLQKHQWALLLCA